MDYGTEQNRSHWGRNAVLGGAAGYMGWRNWPGLKMAGRLAMTAGRRAYYSGSVGMGARILGIHGSELGKAMWGATRAMPGAVRNAYYNGAVRGSMLGSSPLWSGLRNAARRLFVG